MAKNKPQGATGLAADSIGIPEGAIQRNGAFYDFLRAAGIDKGL
jgi:hypothetical protein